jgi:rhamnosyltransferase subunit B
MARVILATFGSLGDVHPVIALALELRRRGHESVVATSANYAEKIALLGLAFHALRPDLLAAGEHIVAELMDGPRGTERLMRDRMFPAVREMYADLAPLVAGADLLVASELVFAAAPLSDAHRVRWVATFLAPVSLFSIHDPPVLPIPRGLGWVQRLGPLVFRLVRRIAKIITRSWWRPVRELRRELGLPPGHHPLFQGKYSPLLNLALFSPVLQRAQPDWPAHTEQAGFCFFDETDAPLPRKVAEFLEAGEPPVVFTLGSAAVYIAGDFYAQAARAAELLGRRAVLLLGKNTAPVNLPPTILACDYLPFAQIFSRACAIVHQGGVGTTAQALRAGRPMLVVPFAHDQFDNAARVKRLGVGRSIAREDFTAAAVARELSALLADRKAVDRAATLGAQIRSERGVERACDALEHVLTSRSSA